MALPSACCDRFARLMAMAKKTKNTRITTWRPVWVDDMPEEMTEGEFYISGKHRLTEHLCACGCGTEVSLPLGRSEWSITYDGDSVSLWPSIGNCRLPCESHYVIRENRTRWCQKWSKKAIDVGRTRDRAKKVRDVERKRVVKSWWKRVLRRIKGW